MNANNGNGKNRADSDVGCLTPLGHRGGISPSACGKSIDARSDISNFGQQKIQTPKIEEAKPNGQKPKFAQTVVLVKEGSPKGEGTPKSANNSLIEHILNSFRGGTLGGGAKKSNASEVSGHLTPQINKLPNGFGKDP